MKFLNGSTPLLAAEEMTSKDKAGFLNNVLMDAANQGRFTCGVYECAQVLETTPDDVMVCVLPNVSSSNVSVHIQHKLIEAYCWENDIQVVRVDSADKLASLLKSGMGALNKNLRVSSEPQDLSCALVRYPEDQVAGGEHPVDVWPDAGLCLPG